MRTAAQTLQERAPEALAIEAIEQEMVQNLHMKLEHAAAWVTAVRAHFSNVVCVTAKEIMGMSFMEMHAICFEAGLSRGDLNNVAILLGSTASPFQWEASPRTTHSDNNVKVKKSKGGQMGNAAEQLMGRRPPMTSYYPPAEFDAHRRYAGTRDETQLRKLIVQEVHAVTGDLYPDLEERNLIFGAIEQLCGTAHLNPIMLGWSPLPPRLLCLLCPLATIFSALSVATSPPP